MTSRCKLALFLLVLSAAAIQTRLHLRISSVETRQHEMETHTAEPVMFCGALHDGLKFVVVQEPGESVRDLVARYSSIVKTGFLPTASPKTESWTDANGDTHQVILDRDPTWTEEQWCKYFEAAVAALQKAFPCD